MRVAGVYDTRVGGKEGRREGVEVRCSELKPSSCH